MHIHEDANIPLVGYWHEAQTGVPRGLHIVGHKAVLLGLAGLLELLGLEPKEFAAGFQDIH